MVALVKQRLRNSVFCECFIAVRTSALLVFRRRAQRLPSALVSRTAITSNSQLVWTGPADQIRVRKV